MHVRIDRDIDAGARPEHADVILTRLRVLASPGEAAPQGHGVLGHLLTDHGRSALELMPCSDRLPDLHRFEHVEAALGLVSVDHVHPWADGPRRLGPAQ